MRTPSRFYVLALGPLLGTALLGQSSNAPAKQTEKSTIVLSPFEVTSESVRGYATTSSTSASRIAVPVTELPSSLITINEQLIADTVAISPEEVLNLVGGMSAMNDSRSQDGNTFALRGYTQTGAQRDGFDDVLFGANGGFDFAFVERMEVSKGPNGSLNGEMSPGGSLNLVGKRPLAKPRTKIGLMVGSYNFYKADLDTSGFVDKAHKLGYRLSTSYRNTDGPNDHPADVNKNKGFLAINPSLRYRFDNGLETWLWTGFIRDKTPRLRRITKTFEAANDDVAHPLYTVADDGGAHNVLTNLAQVKTDNYEVGATKTVTLFGMRADLRLLARHIEQLDSNVLVNATGGADVFVDRAGAIIGTDGRTFDFSRVDSGNLGGFFRTQAQVTGRADTTESNTYATDVNLAFKLGPTQHKLLISGSINEAQRESRPGVDGRTYQVTSADTLQRLGAERVGSTSRIWLYPISRNVFAGIDPQLIIANADTSSAQSETFQDSTRSGLGFNERMSTFRDRLFLTVGARYTHTEITTQTGTAAPSRNATSDWSNSYALLVKAYKGEKGEVSIYANTKSTFIPVFTIDRRLATFGEKYPNRTAEEKELGLKFDLLGSRLVATAAVFDKVEDNALVNEIDEDGTVTGVVGRSFQIPIGERTTKGWDLDLAANITRGLNAVLAYGHVREVQADGTPRSGRAANTWSALSRYEVQTGPLKNLSLLWQYTWWGQSRLNNRTYWVVPPGEIHTAVLGYRWGKYTFRLRTENVFDKLFLRPSVNETAVGVTNHRNYRFSVDFIW
ncbi:MAG: TonB-dependent receptor plug domain-containing protein [Verrucomicrobiota bacterium]